MMAKKQIAVLVSSFILGLLGNLLASWFLQDILHNVFSGPVFVALIAGVLIVIVLIALIDTKLAQSFLHTSPKRSFLIYFSRRFFPLFLLGSLLLGLFAGGGMAIFVYPNLASLAKNLSLPIPQQPFTQQFSVSNKGVVYAVSEGGYVNALHTENGTLLWSYDTGGTIGSLPVIDNGIVYIVLTSKSPQGKNVEAVRAKDGTLLWSYDTGDVFSIPMSPLVDNGIVYLSSHQPNDSTSAEIKALRAQNGTLLWSIQNGLAHVPLVIKNNALYLIHSNKNTSGCGIEALNAMNGKLLWDNDIPENQSCESGLIVGGGVIFLDTPHLFEDNQIASIIYAINVRNGGILWQRGLIGRLINTIVSENVMYFTSCGNTACTVDALNIRDGNIIWEYSPHAANNIYILTVFNEIIYLYSGEISALDAISGRQLPYHFVINTGWNESWSVIRNVVYFFSSYSQKICAVRIDKPKTLWCYTFPYSLVGLPMIGSEVMGVGSRFGYIYQLRTQDGKLLWSYHVRDNTPASVVDIGITS